MPIIVSGGLVGSVCEVGDVWCRVRVITENSAGTGAYVARSGEIGIVSGDVGLGIENKCIMKYLPEDADINEGDLIYTSGVGSVYPRGLLIGRVESVDVDEFARQKTATVKAAVDADSLRYVMIVIDFEIYVEPQVEVS
jgi:rod shape-determining protein MreC